MEDLRWRILNQMKEHGAIPDGLRMELAELERDLEDTHAANASLIALVVLLRGHPEAPKSLQTIAQKELLTHNRGSYLVNELHTLRHEKAELERKLKSSESIKSAEKKILIDEIAAKSELERELKAWREGGVTEEMLRRSNDGAIKVGNGCAIVRADDWEQLCRAGAFSNYGKVCQTCNWTNTGCLNVGESNQPKWICHGCIKRELDKLNG